MPTATNSNRIIVSRSDLGAIDANDWFVSEYDPASFNVFGIHAYLIGSGKEVGVARTKRRLEGNAVATLDCFVNVECLTRFYFAFSTASRFYVYI